MALDVMTLLRSDMENGDRPRGEIEFGQERWDQPVRVYDACEGVIELKHAEACMVRALELCGKIPMRVRWVASDLYRDSTWIDLTR